jgi:hypothetical protein
MLLESSLVKPIRIPILKDLDTKDLVDYFVDQPLEINFESVQNVEYLKELVLRDRIVKIQSPVPQKTPSQESLEEKLIKVQKLQEQLKELTSVPTRDSIELVDKTQDNESLSEDKQLEVGEVESSISSAGEIKGFLLGVG